MILQQMRKGCRVHYFESSYVDQAEAAADGPGPATQADTGIARLVHEQLRSVGTAAAAIFRSRAIDECSFVQISHDMSLSEAQVKSKLYRCLPELRRRLKGVSDDVCR